MAGVDILPERVRDAERLLPGADFRVCDASKLPFADGEFDIVTESTMFVQIVEEDARRAIAGEMFRVCRSGGWIVLSEWRYSKPGSSEYRGLTRGDVGKLFLAGQESDLYGVTNGSLVPLVGRWLSAHAPWAYSLVPAMVPPLVGQVTYLLQKR